MLCYFIVWYFVLWFFVLWYCGNTIMYSLIDNFFKMRILLTTC